MEIRFYRCRHCGQIIAVVNSTGVSVKCCGENMRLIEPGVVDATLEKHVPVIEQKGNLVTVRVGSIPHPMHEQHHIEWIALQTKKGNQRIELKPDDKPEATFAIVEGDEVVNAYAYCNLHSLWEAR